MARVYGYGQCNRTGPRVTGPAKKYCTAEEIVVDPPVDPLKIVL